MDVVNSEQVKIAGSVRGSGDHVGAEVPADMGQDGGVARMSDRGMIKAIQKRSLFR